MYGILIYLRWGGLRGQCRHIWHAWSVWDIVMNSAMLITVSTVSLPRNTYSSILKFVNTHTHTHSVLAANCLEHCRKKLRAKTDGVSRRLKWKCMFLLLHECLKSTSVTFDDQVLRARPRAEARPKRATCAGLGAQESQQCRCWDFFVAV